MGFSEEWDSVYQSGTNLSIWPWSDVVSFMRRYVKQKGNELMVLELGFGAGANIPFFKSIGANYTGIEGSPTIVDKVCLQYPELAEKLIVGDFINHNYSQKFNLILDRSSLTHNDTNSIRNCLTNLYKATQNNAKFIGIDWFSTKHESFSFGKEVDSNTRADIENGQFQGIGSVHFSDQDHLNSLFKETGFEIVVLQHKFVETILPEKNVFAAWNFVAEKI